MYNEDIILGKLRKNREQLENIVQEGLVHSRINADGTDQTATLQAEINALMASGGGTLVLPSGTFTLDGTITLVNDGATPPKQAVLQLVGQGCHWSGRGTVPVGGTTLDIKGTDTYGKLKTNGMGLLYIEGVTFRDTAGTTTPFVYTTNTTLHISHCSFYGSKVRTACNQDAIICGGTQAVEGYAGWDDGFQGYGTIIESNYFQGIRRAVFGRVFFNANVIRDNTVWGNCGSNLAGGAAIEIYYNVADAAASCGNYISGNLIEMPGYPYGIRLQKAQRNVLVANSFFDNVGGVSLAGIRCENDAAYNIIIEGFQDNTYPTLSDATAKLNTIYGAKASWQAVGLSAANYNVDCDSDVQAGLNFRQAGVTKWSTYQNVGSTVLYLRDMVNARTYASIAQGTTVDNSTLTLEASATISGSLKHNGSKASFFNSTLATKPTVSGSRADGGALNSLLTALTTLGLITNSTTT